VVFPTTLTANNDPGYLISVICINDTVQISPLTDPDYWKMFSSAESYWQADTCDTCQIRLTLPTLVTLDDIQIVSTVPVETIRVGIDEVDDFTMYSTVTPGIGLSTRGKRFWFDFTPAKALLQITSITATLSGSPASGYVVPLAESGALPPAPSRPTSGLVYPRSR